MFAFIDILFVKQDIQKGLKTKIWFEPQIFIIFLPMIWIFMEGEGDEIKSKQASKRDTTLFTICGLAPLWVRL